jgi:DNA-binding MarR family transcriptional regulator
MTASPARLHLGQLLAHTTRHFQVELYRRLAEAGLGELRVPHTHVSAYIEADGSRLTDLARKARMTVPAMLELIDDLEGLGYAERRPDPLDRRAKLIVMTAKGWDSMRLGQRIIRELEAEYARAIGEARFEEFMATFQALLDHLSSDESGARSSPTPSQQVPRQ